MGVGGFSTLMKEESEKGRHGPWADEGPQGKIGAKKCLSGMRNENVYRMKKTHEERRNQDVIVFHSLKSMGHDY